MGIARHFNGVADFLTTQGSANATYQMFTFGAWVKRDAAGANRNGLAGRLFSADNGWAVFIDENNLISFLGCGTPGYTTWPAPDLSEWGYLAVSFNNFEVDGRVRFYYGTSAATITLLGSVPRPGSAFAELGAGPGIYLGAVYQGNLISVTSWNGTLDQIGLWLLELTLAEIKEAALCGSRVRLDFTAILADITGADPEPARRESNPSAFLSVSGTTVVSGPNVGCDYGPIILTGVEAAVQVDDVTAEVDEPGQLVTCM